jgi:uncharacterized protein
VATKRAAPRNAKPSTVPSKAKVEKLVSIPDDVVLAPQVEAPRQQTGRDLSRQRSTARELSWADFDRAVQGLARAIRKTFTPQAIVGVAHGGVFVGGALASALDCEFFPVRISRRSRDRQGGAKPQMFGDMPRELKGLRVLIVDDVASSGDTLELASTRAREAGAREVKTAVLVARPDGYAPSFLSLKSAEVVVFPWDYEPTLAGTVAAGDDVDPDKAGA